VIRGDVGTIIDHIEAMSDMKLQKRIYKALSLAALDLVKKRKVLDKKVLERLKRVLEEI